LLHFVADDQLALIRSLTPDGFLDGRYVACREDRERCGKRRTRDAIADRMDRRHVERTADRIDRVDLRTDIVVPYDMLHRRIRGAPRYHEHGDALFDRPADEALFGAQV
jgi:hypothetical protein